MLWTFFNVYLDAGLHVSAGLIGAVMAVGNLLPGMDTRCAAGDGALGERSHRSAGLRRYGTQLASSGARPPLGRGRHWLRRLSFPDGAREAGPHSVRTGSRGTGLEVGMSGALLMAHGASSAALALGAGYAMAALGYRSPHWIAAGLTAAGAMMFSAIFLRTPSGDVAQAAGTVSEPSASVYEAGAGQSHQDTVLVAITSRIQRSVPPTGPDV